MVTTVGTPGPETLDGTAGDDFLYGLGGNDILNGFGGNDLLDGGTGDDEMNGGTGDDIFVVDSSGDIVNEDVGEGFDIVYAIASYVLASGTSIEWLSVADHGATTAINLTGNDNDMTILGNNGVNILTGGNGNNSIFGYGGGDTIDGGDGNDALYGMDGNDTLSGGDGNDFFEGGAGNDTLNGEDGDDIFIVTNAGDIVNEFVNRGFDIVYASTSYALAAGAHVERLSVIDHSATTAINLTSGDSGTQILGNIGANVLTGGNGNDLILGFAGGDRLIGDDGNDGLFGMEGQDELFGNNGNDYIDGGTGADRLSGSGGDDVFVVDDSADVAFDSGVGNDLIYTSVDFWMGEGIESLLAIDNTATTPLRLFGNSSANFIYGNNGVNVLSGGRGADVLTGYGGADIFNFQDMDPGFIPGIDTLVDFQLGVDKLKLDTTKFLGILGAGPGFLEITDYATNANTRIIYNSVTGKLAYDPDGNGAQNPYVFAQLAPGLALTASDFLIVANQAPEVHPDTFDILFTGNQVSRVISAGQNDIDLDGNMSIVRMAHQGGSFQNIPQGGLSPTVIVGTYGSMIAGGIGVPIDYVLSATDPDTQAIALGQTVFETFVYEASDGALTAQTTITIAITRGTAAASMAVVEAKTDGRGSDFAAAPDSAFQGAPAGEDASAAGNARAHLDHLAGSDFWVAYA